MSLVTDDLKSVLASVPADPVLFVGSGFSRRYIGLPTWENLLRIVSERGGVQFDRIAAMKDQDLPAVAQECANLFFDAWHNEYVFHDSRLEYAKQVRRRDDPFRFEICKEVRALRTVDPAVAEELEILRNGNISSIITTNWDRLLEDLFPKFSVFVGQQDLLFSSPQGVAEIYKIHGSCDDPRSLVLTKDDYLDYGHRNAVLVSKLMSMFVEHPVVFVGYSLNDENIKSIFRQIASCVGNRVRRLRDRIIMVRRAKGEPDSVATTIMAIDGVEIPYTQVIASSFGDVYAAMNAPRRFPAPILRRLRESVFELVKNNSSLEKVHALGISDDTNENDVEIVFGVGVIREVLGYAGITIHHLMCDVIFDDGRYDAERVLDVTVRALPKNVKFVPVYKYAAQCQGTDPSSIRGWVGTSSADFEDNSRRKAHRGRVRKLGSLAALEAAEPDPTRSCNDVAFLAPDMITVPELRDYLQRHFNHFEHPKHDLVKQNFRKLTCLLDFLEYGPSAVSGSSPPAL